MNIVRSTARCSVVAVDRKAAAEELAAFRSMDAQLSENIDPAAAPPRTARRRQNYRRFARQPPKPTTESLIGSAVQQWADRIMRRIDGAFEDSNRDKHRS